MMSFKLNAKILMEMILNIRSNGRRIMATMYSTLTQTVGHICLLGLFCPSQPSFIYVGTGLPPGGYSDIFIHT